MSVTKRLRAKVASSVSKIEETETFLWNKFLRVGELDYKEIETFTTELWKTDHIPLIVKVQGVITPFKFKFSKVKTLKLSSKRLALKSKTNPVFFGLGNTTVTNINISFDHKLKQLIAVRITEEGVSAYLKIKEQGEKEASYELTSRLINLEDHLLFGEKYFNSIKGYPLGVKTGVIKDINYHIKLPRIIDYLSQLKPEIYNIELLSPLENSMTGTAVSNTKINLLDVPLSISNINYLKLDIEEDLLNSPFDFDPQIITGTLSLYSDLFKWNTKRFRIKIPNFDAPLKTYLSIFYEGDSSSPVTIESDIEMLLADKINKIIQPRIELSQEEEQVFFEKLSNYQIEGAKFLATNKNALLADELGLNKTIQALFAIKFLLMNREIKSVLIITNKNSTGDLNIFAKTGSSYGWLGHLQKFAPELSCNCIDSESIDIRSQLGNDSKIKIISYTLLYEALINNNLKKDIVRKYDCLIFDDAENLKIYQNNLLQFIDMAAPKFCWILSGLEVKEYSDNILPEFNPSVFLSHKYNEVRDQVPGINETDFWLTLDKEQQYEYDQLIFLARNSLKEILSTGNPFRFQSQLFFFIHQLKQICNFSSDEIDSNKTKLLLSHINCLNSYKKQAIIFSQYDKSGTQKLTKLFDREKIKYKKSSQEMTPVELAREISGFEKDSSFTVFLEDSQTMKSSNHVLYAPYIIHFDHWWTPISRWNLENKVKNNSDRTVNVFNYFTKKTIDEDILGILFNKQLLDRETSGKIGPDAFSKILNEEEWKKVFDLDKEVKPQKKKKGD